MIKLFISSLPFSLTAQKLSQLFSPYGQVKSANISFDSVTTESQRCGYVEMEDLFDAQTAIKVLNGKELEGRRIAVSFAVSKSKAGRS